LDQFNEITLHPSIQKALDGCGFTKPTAIQAQAIPLALEGHDVKGIAQTGSGKTVAFCVPILSFLLEDSSENGLVLVPTRELALQVESVWKNLTKHTQGMNCAVVIGGAAMSPQIKALSRKPRLIVATPGRLIDHLKRRTVHINQVSVLVLDEADRMLDMGFAPQLQQILKDLPADRQTLFFSATWDAKLDKLAQAYLHEPKSVTVGQVSQAAPQIEQSVLNVRQRDKNQKLLDEITAREGSVLVFARTKHRTDKVARYLSDYGLDVGRIHGDRTQKQRVMALESFRRGQTRVLIATDIAARGIDVANIAHVINFDLPQSSEDYIHRIGRTGRAGAKGHAVSFVTPEDRGQWRYIARLLQKTGSPVPVLEASDGVNQGADTDSDGCPEWSPEQNRPRPRREGRSSFGGGSRDGRFRDGRSRDGRGFGRGGRAHAVGSQQGLSHRR
jgi:ATP-dependent RNA helicase RhlE